MMTAYRYLLTLSLMTMAVGCATEDDAPDSEAGAQDVTTSVAPKSSKEAIQHMGRFVKIGLWIGKTAKGETCAVNTQYHRDKFVRMLGVAVYRSDTQGRSNEVPHEYYLYEGMTGEYEPYPDEVFTEWKETNDSLSFKVTKADRHGDVDTTTIKVSDLAKDDGAIEFTNKLGPIQCKDLAFVRPPPQVYGGG